MSYQEQRYNEAIADLKRAGAGGADTARVAYGLALAYTATDDPANALRQLDVLFAHDLDHEGGRKLANLLDRGEEYFFCARLSPVVTFLFVVPRQRLPSTQTWRSGEHSAADRRPGCRIFLLAQARYCPRP